MRTLALACTSSARRPRRSWLLCVGAHCGCPGCALCCTRTVLSLSWIPAFRWLRRAVIAGDDVNGSASGGLRCGQLAAGHELSTTPQHSPCSPADSLCCVAHPDARLQGQQPQRLRCRARKQWGPRGTRPPHDSISRGHEGARDALTNAAGRCQHCAKNVTALCTCTEQALVPRLRSVAPSTWLAQWRGHAAVATLLHRRRRRRLSPAAGPAHGTARERALARAVTAARAAPAPASPRRSAR